MTTYERARKAFDMYCAYAPPQLPEDRLSRLQVLMARWVNTKVNHKLPHSVEGTLGACEEWGEYQEAAVELLERKIGAALGKLAHIELNVSQDRRYSKLSAEELRAKKADAIADACVFLMTVCIAERIDFGVLLEGTVDEVLKRDWKANPAGVAGPVAPTFFESRTCPWCAGNLTDVGKCLNSTCRAFGTSP